jgi:hypothetical protein
MNNHTLYQNTPYQTYLKTLRDKDRPGPMLPTGCIATVHANYAGNYMGKPVSSWGNPQNAPPSCWKGLTDGNT